MDLLWESPEQVGPLLETYRRVIGGYDDGRDTWRKLRALNQLGVTRGTVKLIQMERLECGPPAGFPYAPGPQRLHSARCPT